MINWKGCGSKRSWPNLRYPGTCLEKVTKTTKNLSVGPRFGPATPRIQIRSVNHSTTTFGIKISTKKNLKTSVTTQDSLDSR
jgi:hypothetical protein